MKRRTSVLTLDDIKNSAAGKRNAHLFKKGDVKKHKQSKYRSQRVDEDGLTFDSKKEARRYKDLRLLLKVGKIGFLARQVEFPLMMEGQKAASYIADFTYTDAETGIMIVEDVKSEVTRKLPVYRLKKKMMLLQHKIEVREV
jgi:Protein of unknown function (DUF1064)